MRDREVTRRGFMAASAAGLAAGWAGCSAPTPQSAASTALPERPNIVLIILDTLRADKLGCYGYPADTSPEFDALAQAGVRFDRVISQCPWTRPSCGSLLTSLYPRTLGLYKEQNEVLPPHFDTLPKLLQQAGYRTYGITANPNLNEIYNFHLGFDAYEDSAVIFGWMDKEPGKQVRTRGMRLPSAPEMFAKAVDWAKQGEGPAYMQINAMEIHEWLISNTMVRPEFQDLYTNLGERYPRYLQSVRQLTHDVAAFIRELSLVPGWDNTVFALLADHGEGLDDHGDLEHDRVHGWLLYESAVVVPWVLYHPTWRPARNIVPQPVRLLEVTPTLLDLAGVPAPEAMEGRSMLPVLTGAAGAVEMPEYLMTETQWRDANKLGAYASDWKLFENKARMAGAGPIELQPRGGGERGSETDQSQQHPDTTAAMKAYVDQWAAQYPEAPPMPQSKQLTPEEVEQMQAIGYLGGTEDQDGS